MKALEPADVWNRSQSWHYSRLWEVAGQKVRVEITVNSYAEQSSARVKVFSPSLNQWNPLAEIPFDEKYYQGKRITYVLPTVDQNAFLPDEKKLLDKAALILSPIKKKAS